MVEIYADMVFLINFIMDILIFWIVSKLIKQKIKISKIILGGFLSTFLFCLIIFIPVLQLMYNFPTMLLVLMLGISVTFSPKNIKEFAKLIILANISAFCIGGMGMALFYFTNISNIIGNMVGFYVSDFSFKLLIVVSSTSYIIIKLFGNWFKKIFFKRQRFYEIKIYFENENTKIVTLLDTGNSLKDPLSKSPVIIAEFDYIKEFLPNDLKIIFYEKREHDFDEVFLNMDLNFSKRIRMIPFESLGKQNGMLIGFRSDKVEVFYEEDVFVIKDVIIGIYNFKLSKDNSYQGLLNPELVPINF